MIVYSPINGEVLTNPITFYPQHAFIITKLGEPLSQELLDIRSALKKELNNINFIEIDASSLMTGGDFLDKIWKTILGVPLGIVILTEEMPLNTIANIYYELGMMDALGKETLIIKGKDYKIASDLTRTEYLKFDGNFSKGFKKFIKSLKEREEHYWLMAELMSKNPVLAIDYIKRAYLINPLKKYKDEAERIFKLYSDVIDNESKIHIINFLRCN